MRMVLTIVATPTGTPIQMAIKSDLESLSSLDDSPLPVVVAVLLLLLPPIRLVTAAF